MAEQFPHDNDDIDATIRSCLATMRSCEASLNVLYCQLCGCAQFLLDRLLATTNAIKDVAINLEKVGEPWAISLSQRLRLGLEQATIKRTDREGKILFSLPGKNEEVAEWLRKIKLADENSDWLVAATRYAFDRWRTLLATAASVAVELSQRGEDALSAQLPVGRPDQWTQ